MPVTTTPDPNDKAVFDTALGQLWQQAGVIQHGRSLGDQNRANLNAENVQRLPEANRALDPMLAADLGKQVVETRVRLGLCLANRSTAHQHWLQDQASIASRSIGLLRGFISSSRETNCITDVVPKIDVERFKKNIPRMKQILTQIRDPKYYDLGVAGEVFGNRGSGWNLFPNSKRPNNCGLIWNKQELHVQALNDAKAARDKADYATAKIHDGEADTYKREFEVAQKSQQELERLLREFAACLKTVSVPPVDLVNGGKKTDPKYKDDIDFYCASLTDVMLDEIIRTPAVIPIGTLSCSLEEVANDPLPERHIKYLEKLAATATRRGPATVVSSEVVLQELLERTYATALGTAKDPAKFTQTLMEILASGAMAPIPAPVAPPPSMTPGDPRFFVQPSISAPKANLKIPVGTAAKVDAAGHLTALQNTAQSPGAIGAMTRHMLDNRGLLASASTATTEQHPAPAAATAEKKDAQPDGDGHKTQAAAPNEITGEGGKGKH